MKKYKELCYKVLNEGEEKIGRNGKTISYTGLEFRHDMNKGFPILTIREMSLKNAITELRFFIQGLTDGQWLEDRGNMFWSKFKSKTRSTNFPKELGPIYGAQWRNFNDSGFDQLKEVIETLKTNPLSRRMLVSAWNPNEIEDMALPPCHDSFQFISNGNQLDLIWRQRSCDMAIGLPYDILLYGLLLSLVSTEVGMQPRWLIGQLGDCHVYEQNQAQLEEVLKREEKILPELELIWANKGTIFEWAESDDLSKCWILHAYNPRPKVKFEVVP